MSMSLAPRRRWLVAFATVLFFAFAGVWLWSAGSLLLLPAFTLVLGIWAIGGLVLGLYWAMVNVVVPVARTGGRLGSISWEAIASDPVGRRMHQRVERGRSRLRPLEPVGAWVERRIRPGRGGLRRTVTVVGFVATAVALWQLGILSMDPTSALTATDRRIADMAGQLNASSGRALMLALTAAGRTPVMAVIVAVLVVGTLLSRAGRAAVLLLGITLGSAVVVAVLKATVGRVRPDLGQLVETSSSWPSGHASAGLALALAVVVAWHVAGRRRWALMAAVVVPVGMLVGYSRGYLVVHWSSDVLAGWLVAVAVTWLVLAIDDIAGPSARRTPDERYRRWFTAAGVVAIAIFGVAGFLGRTTQLPSLQDPAPTVLTGDDPALALDFISPFSETLTGQEMEPIGLVIAARDDTIRSAISAAGWSVADDPSTSRLLEVYWAGLRGQDDLTAPVTPTFLDERMQDIAIEKPASDNGGVRQRHHARLWRLDVTTSDGCPVWVATASFDERVEWTLRTVLPTHHIDPAIDEEQAFLVADLTGTGDLIQIGTTRVTDPMLGTNAAGDPWFSDGVASVLTSSQGCTD